MLLALVLLKTVSTLELLLIGQREISERGDPADELTGGDGFEVATRPPLQTAVDGTGDAAGL